MAESEQSPPWCAPLTRNKRLSWLRITAIPLDFNGFDVDGHYKGRTGNSWFRVDYPDGQWRDFQASSWDLALLRLKRLYPRAKIEFGKITRWPDPQKMAEQMLPPRKFPK